MKKDWHLAKRFYDLASETSVDAKVPVALAILKLSLMFKVESMKDVSISHHSFIRISIQLKKKKYLFLPISFP